VCARLDVNLVHVKQCEAQRIKGWFYLPEASDDRVPGILTWEPGDVATLELIGGFSPRPPYKSVADSTDVYVDELVGAANDSVVTPTVKTRSSRFHGITLADLVGAGLLAPGTRLVSVNTVWPASAVVVNGTIEVHGKTYPTPSAAGSAVKSGALVNGWDFWAIEEPSGKMTLATLRARFVDARGAGGAQPS
jgi:hypothetical protein